MDELAGQVALVTGASTGIGRHLVEGLTARGMAVAGLARGEDRLRTTWPRSAPPRGTHPRSHCRRHRPGVGERRGRRTVAELGQIDLLVNNAGRIDAAEEPLWEADPDQWWDVVASHIRGRLPALPHRRALDGLRNSGRIVNIASGMSVRPRPSTRPTPSRRPG